MVENRSRKAGEIITTKERSVVRACALHFFLFLKWDRSLSWRLGTSEYRLWDEWWLAQLPKEKLLKSISFRGVKKEPEKNKKSFQVTLLAQQPQSVPMETLRAKVTFGTVPRWAETTKLWNPHWSLNYMRANLKKSKERGWGSCP